MLTESLEALLFFSKPIKVFYLNLKLTYSGKTRIKYLSNQIESPLNLRNRTIYSYRERKELHLQINSFELKKKLIYTETKLHFAYKSKNMTDNASGEN